MKLDLSLFSAVGAAHLKGEVGLLKLLEARGYKVSPVKADFTGVSEEYQEKFKNKKGVFYERITEGFSIIFPGSPAVSDVKQSNQKMYFYQEVGTSLYYMFMSVNAVDINLDKHKMMKEMLQTMNARMGIENGKSEKIVFKGLEGRESDISTDMLNGYVRILLNKNKLYLMLVAGSEDDVEENQLYIDQFLNSFEYFDIEKEVVYWDNVVDKAYAVQFEMPETYTSLPFTIKNPSDLSGSPYFFNLYSSVDHKANCSYLVRSNDFPVGYCSVDDAYLFEEIGNLIQEEYQATIIKQIDTTLEGYPANLIYFDLSRYIKLQLKLMKITNLDCINIDTFSKKNNFFTARRSLHLSHDDYGRNISLIMIN